MGHETVSRIRPGADTAVLFIHGIVGTPHHFDFLLPLVPAGWSMINLLLDGHGRGVRDFSRSSMARWEAQVADTVAALAATHRQVVIVGHSMGTLFALDAAIDRPQQVAALFLLATPLRLAPRPRAFYNALRVGLDLHRSDPELTATRAAYGITPDRRIWRYVGWIPRYLELFRKIRQTNRRLTALSVPTTVFQSAEDELVSRKATAALKNRPGVILSALPRSTHYAYHPTDRQTVETAFAALCQQLS